MHSSSPSISQLPDSDYTLSFENSPSNRHSIFLFSGTSFNPSRLCDDRSPQPTNFKSKPPPYKPLFSFFSSTPCFYFSSNLFPLSLCAPFFPNPSILLIPKRLRHTTEGNKLVRYLYLQPFIHRSHCLYSIGPLYFLLTFSILI